MAATMTTEAGGVPVVRDDRGIVSAPGTLLADVSGARNVGTGSDWFPLVFDEGVFIDKSLLVCDVLRGNQVKLYCRPRRFGKTLAATMLQDFLSANPAPTRKPVPDSGGWASGRRTMALGGATRVRTRSLRCR